MRLLFVFPLAVLLSGCTAFSGLPEGEVPENLVQPAEPQTDGMSREDAEAAVCGAIVRTLIRRGHTSGRVSVSIAYGSLISENFRTLLSGTNMIRFTGAERAVYFLQSSMGKQDWTVQLLQKDGAEIFRKTVQLHP